MEEHEHTFTKEVVCPWCGYEHGDSWERGSPNDLESYGDDDCGRCGKKFAWHRDFSVWYNTEKVEANKTK